MSEILEKVSSGANHAGQECVYCRETIKAEHEVVICPRCKSPHHADCWKSNGGCGTRGCPQIAKGVMGERSKGDGPPPPISRRTIFAVAGLLIIVIAAILLWPKPQDPAMGRTEIVFLAEGGYDLHTVMMTAAEEFNSANDDIYLDLQLLPLGTLETKLVVLIFADHAPDIVAVSEEYFLNLRSEGALLALGEDAAGEPIYGIDHPAASTKIVVWGATEHPVEALEVLDFLIPRIPPRTEHWPN